MDESEFQINQQNNIYHIADDKNKFFKLLTEEFYKFPPEKLTSLFSHLDLIYEEIIKDNGGNNFLEPHFKKKKGEGILQNEN